VRIVDEPPGRSVSKKSVQRWYFKEAGLSLKPRAGSGLQKVHELFAACSAEGVGRATPERCWLLESVLPIVNLDDAGPINLPSSVNGSGFMLPDVKIPCSPM
jgi:hypothetical protein